MSATSTQGVGKGAANHKGPKNGREVFVPKLSPHVVAAGHVTPAGGTATVTFPTALDEAAANYAVIVTPQAATTTVPKITTKTDTSGVFASFVLTADNVAHAWMVVRLGNV